MKGEFSKKLELFKATCLILNLAPNLPLTIVPSISKLIYKVSFHQEIMDLSLRLQSDVSQIVTIYLSYPKKMTSLCVLLILNRLIINDKRLSLRKIFFTNH